MNTRHGRRLVAVAAVTAGVLCGGSISGFAAAAPHASAPTITTLSYASASGCDAVAAAYWRAMNFYHPAGANQ